MPRTLTLGAQNYRQRCGLLSRRSPFNDLPGNLQANRCRDKAAFKHTFGERLLDSDEAAALLGIHKKTLQRMARTGELPGFQIGDLWRFRASILNEWLASKLAS